MLVSGSPVESALSAVAGGRFPRLTGRRTFDRIPAAPEPQTPGDGEIRRCSSGNLLQGDRKGRLKSERRKVQMTSRIAILLGTAVLIGVLGCQKSAEPPSKPSSPAPVTGEPGPGPAAPQASASELPPPAPGAAPQMEGSGTASPSGAAASQLGQQPQPSQPEEGATPEEGEGGVRIGRLMGGLVRAARSAVPVPAPGKKAAPTSEAPPFVPPQPRP